MDYNQCRGDGFHDAHPDDLVAHSLLRRNGQFGSRKEWVLYLLNRRETPKEGKPSALLFCLGACKHVFRVTHAVLGSLILLGELRVVFKIFNAAILGGVAKRARVWRVAVGWKHRTLDLLPLSRRCPQILLVKSPHGRWRCVIHLVAVLVVRILVLQVLDEVLQQVPVFYLALRRHSQERKCQKSGEHVWTLKVPQQASRSTSDPPSTPTTPVSH